MNKEEFIQELKKLEISLSEKQIKMLETYKEKLKEQNKIFNLTTIEDDNGIYLKHFYDCLTITKVIDLSNKQKLLDIGTGAGFPGLVLKIVYPNLNVTLVDSNNKKIEFLNKLIKELNLKDITAIATRAEIYTRENKEKFDIITSRAVSKTNILLEIGINALKINGKYVIYKGKIEEELNETKKALTTLNTKIIQIKNFKLPIENSTRNIIVIEKIKETDKKYPRNYSQIIKKPL